MATSAALSFASAFADDSLVSVEPNQPSRAAQAFLVGAGTWGMLSLGIGGLGRLLYVALGEPNWFGWTAPVVLPVMIVASGRAAVDAYRDTSLWSPGHRWTHSDTVLLVALMVLLAFGAGVWLVTGSFAGGVMAAVVLAVLTGVAALIVAGLRLSGGKS